MFNPSVSEVRRFFASAWQKHLAALADEQTVSGDVQGAITPLESMAASWIALHPEYHDVLQDTDRALAYQPSIGHQNLFFHLGAHLAIAEQLSIDQPVGIRPVFERLCGRLGDAHQAAHAVMDCLGDEIQLAQQTNGQFDGERYLASIMRLV